MWFCNERIIKRNFAGRVGTAEGGELRAVGEVGKREKDFFRFGEMAGVEELLCLIIF